MTDNEIIKATDLLDKFDFFYGQRAGRELWNEKPVDIQDKDIESFSNDVAFLKDFINRQRADIERLEKENKNLLSKLCKKLRTESKAVEKLIKAEAIKEFAERLVAIYENDKRYDRPHAHTLVMTLFRNIDNLVKEMVGEG